MKKNFGFNSNFPNIDKSGISFISPNLILDDPNSILSNVSQDGNIIQATVAAGAATSFTQSANFYSEAIDILGNRIDTKNMDFPLYLTSYAIVSGSAVDLEGLDIVHGYSESGSQNTGIQFGLGSHYPDSTSNRGIIFSYDNSSIVSAPDTNLANLDGNAYVGTSFFIRPNSLSGSLILFRYSGVAYTDSGYTKDLNSINTNLNLFLSKNQKMFQFIRIIRNKTTSSPIDINIKFGFRSLNIPIDFPFSEPV